MVEPSPPQAIESLLRPGQVLDHKYVVERLIGIGGMGVVWAAVNKRTAKPVALKVLLERLADDEKARGRFRLEALAAGRINHPNVVTIFDVFEFEGRDCMVMEYLAGETLAERLARTGPLAPEEALPLLLPALRGVAAAHAHRVIHRDLKPHNIFLCAGPGGEYVTTKVLDFGISKIQKAVTSEQDLANTARFMGTPQYTAPELITGQSAAGRRTDVYGFGVVLYEALTGHRPFEGLKGIPLLSHIANEAPASISSFRPDLDPNVVALVERAMAKDPDDRYRSVEMLIGAIEAILPAAAVLGALTPVVGVPIIPPRGLGTSSESVVLRRPRLPWMIAGIASTIAVGLAVWIAVHGLAQGPGR
jgi:eukaryotic-like serine/threonine-protein kinase